MRDSCTVLEGLTLPASSSVLALGDRFQTENFQKKYPEKLQAVFEIGEVWKRLFVQFFISSRAALPESGTQCKFKDAY